MAHGYAEMVADVPADMQEPPAPKPLRKPKKKLVRRTGRLLAGTASYFSGGFPADERLAGWRFLCLGEAVRNQQPCSTVTAGGGRGMAPHRRHDECQVLAADRSRS